jgi:hypothetical protein
MRHAARLPTASVLAILAIALVDRPAAAGEWHNGPTSVCSDCHTMHNSQQGSPMRYDRNPEPGPHLLRHADSLSLCIHCHDGAMPGSPDVVAPVSYTADPPGGFFPTNYTNPSGIAHVLGTAKGLVPPGGTQAMVLTCVSCHDPHGGPNFRNLQADPLRKGTRQLVAAKQKVVADGSNASSVYLSSNITYKAGMSAWCGRCHGDFHGRSSGSEGTGSPWLRHPQDQALSSSKHVDYTYWLGPVSNRVRVQSPTDDDIPSSDDQVFCLSCHKAHGSSNHSTLIYADGARLSSTCEQCHNK